MRCCSPCLSAMSKHAEHSVPPGLRKITATFSQFAHLKAPLSNGLRIGVAALAADVEDAVIVLHSLEVLWNRSEQNRVIGRCD